MKHSTFLLCQMIIGLLILLAVNALAADSGSLILGEFNARDKVDRTQIAKDIKSQMERLDSYIPNLKPSDIEWINQERIAIEKIQGTDAHSSRLRHFYESPEFQQQKLKHLLNDINKALDRIMSTNINLNSEMLWWAVTSHKLSDRITFNDSIMILREHGRLPSDIVKKLDLWMGDSSKYEFYGQGIMEYIIIPYLAGEIK